MSSNAPLCSGSSNSVASGLDSGYHNRGPAATDDDGGRTESRVAISAPTLGAALDVIERFCHLRNPSFRARVRQQRGELRLEINQCLALLEEERLPLIETFLLSFQGIVEAVLGGPMTEGRFEIAAPAPPYVRRYHDFFHGEVRGAAPITAMVIPAKWSGLRCPKALLREGSLTAAELAYRLGYEDAANFNRACRRWFGSSPGRLRQKRPNLKGSSPAAPPRGLPETDWRPTLQRVAGPVSRRGACRGQRS